MARYGQRAVTVSPPTPGRLLGGRYQLDRPLAAGGMAQVWEGTDLVLQRPIAVKILKSALADDPTIVERFRREALAAARLHHPSIVPVFDTIAVDGLSAIVMPLVRGKTLRQVLDSRGRLAVDEARVLGMQLADALDAAHHAGIVHRDIKPGNILLTPDGRALLSDFGIAKATASDDDLTSAGMVGTAKYLAPEQVTGGTVDGRADLYALGVVLYECLAGSVPFRGDSDTATAFARLHMAPPSLRERCPGIPSFLDDAVSRCLAVDPERRPSSGAELAAALRSPADTTEPVPVTRNGTPPRGQPMAPTVAFAAARTVDDTLARTVVRDATPPHLSTAAARAPGRWVGPAVVAVTLLVALAVAVVVANRTDAGNRFLHATLGLPAHGTAPGVLAITEIDPPPGDGHEDPTHLPALTDGDPATAWTTEQYHQSSLAFKTGVGLAFSLTGAPHHVTIVSPSIGWSVRIYVADSSHPDFAGWGEPVVTRSGISGDGAFDLPPLGSFVLVLFTDVGSDGQLRIGEVRFG